MDKQTEPYVLSFEYSDGTVKQAGFHHGSDLDLARKDATSRYYSDKNIRTVAIKQGDKVISTYNGNWSRKF